MLPRASPEEAERAPHSAETDAASPRAGFTLIELMVVIAVVAIIMSVAIPRLMSARTSANESAAISTLRSIVTSQAQVQSSAMVDTDGDGSGEFAYFAELSGTLPLRVTALGAPAAGVAGVDNLPQPLLPVSFGAVNGASEVLKSGYYFQVWLPAATVGGAIVGIAEDPGGGKLGGPFPNPDNGELFWCAYAWPLQVRRTGNRAFFVNQRGDLLQTSNRGGGAYSGTGGGPAFDAAFSVPLDMSSVSGINGIPANDGNLWVLVQ